MKFNFDLKLVKKIKNDKIGILPTDTIYGICASAFSKIAVERIYQLRERDKNKPFIILIGAFSDLGKFSIKVNPKTEGLLKKYWPGKVSVILPCSQRKFHYLHRGGESLAFRLPNDGKLIDLIRQTGPVVATSANLQGKPPATTIKEAKSYFGSEVDFYVDGGKLDRAPSALIEIKNGRIIVRRK